jgi:hypothetical protein
MRKDYPTKFLKKISGGAEFHWDGIPARGRSGGILLGVTKETYDVVEKQKGFYFVRFLISSKFHNFTWNLVVVYGDAQQDGKANFLVELVNVIISSTYPILITGDFNMTRKDSEKNKPGGYNRWSPLFNVVIEQGGLMEINLSGRKFTWCNNHEDPTCELLDKVLVSPSWEGKFPLVCAITLPGELSDHTPILIKSGDKPRTNPIFRFENYWFSRPDLQEIIKKVWDMAYSGDGNIHIWQKRFDYLRKTLKGWDLNIEGEYKRKRGAFAMQLDEIDKKGGMYGLTQSEMEEKNAT